MVEFHAENSDPEKSDRASRLDGNTVEPSAKRPRLDECTTAKASLASHPSMIHGNCAQVSFDGFNGANVSSLKNASSKTEPIEDITPSDKEECIE